MNIVFSLTVIFLGTLAGLHFSRRLKERERLISAIILLVKELTVKISYTNTEIGDMLRYASEEQAYSDLLFVKNCSLIQENGDFHSEWEKGVKEQPFLDTRDRELLFALGEKLGETDGDGQLSFLEMTLEMLEKQHEQALEDYRRKGRMYRSVGALCGLALGIMVL